MIEGGSGLRGLSGETGGLGRSVGVEGWSVEAGAGPEAGADYFVRVSFAGDGIGAGAFGGAAAGEARDAEVEASPEEMDWTALADEAGAKLLEDIFTEDQDAPEAVGEFGIVGGVQGIFFERDGGWDLARRSPDFDFDAERVQGGHEFGIEVRDRLRLEGESLGGTPTGLNGQLVIDEVELDFENAIAVGDGGSGEAARVDVEGNLPPVIDERGESEADFADDLSPHVERGVGVLPGREGQIGPGVADRAVSVYGHSAILSACPFDVSSERGRPASVLHCLRRWRRAPYSRSVLSQRLRPEHRFSRFGSPAR